MSREQLISRKHAVQRQIAQTRQRLESAPRAVTASTRWGQYWQRRRIKRESARWQSKLESLMAQEYQLRQEIDRSR